MSDRQKKNQSAADRACILDLWRFSAIVAMIFYHLVYDLGSFGYCKEALIDSVPCLMVKYFCSGSFILICGICCRYSSDNIRRGFRLLVWALLITAVTTLAGVGINFGILHFLGLSTLLYGAYEKRYELPQTVSFPLFCAACFILTAFAVSGIRLPFSFLSFLGLRGREYSSMDYYPVFPWIFLYLTGVWLGCRYGEKFCRMKPGGRKLILAEKVGRHSLPIYLIHQPVLIGIVLIYGKIFH